MKYKLEGFDSGWINPGTQRFAQYLKVPPGNYVFRVKACNNDGLWNEQGASLPLILFPHFRHYQLSRTGHAGSSYRADLTERPLLLFRMVTKSLAGGLNLNDEGLYAGTIFSFCASQAKDFR